MKIAQINSTCGIGSTGKICVAISKLLDEKGIENRIYYTLYSTDHANAIKYSNYVYEKLQALKSRVFGNYGFNSHIATCRLIKELENFAPDIVHLHNIHSHDCNLSMLFNYLKKKNIRVYWTFHDCWVFTGGCTHFTYAQCSKWKEGCSKCPQRRLTSWFFDRSYALWNKKKEALLGANLTIITPSEWLANLVKESFLKDCPVLVINNGIDLSVFKPREQKIKQKLGIAASQHMILGVSFGWSIYKGIDVFIELAKRLTDDYKIVLVGTDEEVDKILPSNIISIHRTMDQVELAELYSAADVFVNATREENFPTVHLEAIACGTPVVSFDTGGCREMLDPTCGITVPTNDIDALQREIEKVCESNALNSEDCVYRAQKYNKDVAFDDYVSLYLKS